MKNGDDYYFPVVCTLCPHPVKHHRHHLVSLHPAETEAKHWHNKSPTLINGRASTTCIASDSTYAVNSHVPWFLHSCRNRGRVHQWWLVIITCSLHSVSSYRLNCTYGNATESCSMLSEISFNIVSSPSLRYFKSFLGL